MTVITIALTDTFDQWRVAFNEAVTVQNAQISDVARAALTTTATDIVPAINEVKADIDAFGSPGDFLLVAGDTMEGDLLLDAAVDIQLSATSTIKKSGGDPIIDNDGIAPSVVPLDAHEDGTPESVLAFDGVGTPYYELISNLAVTGSGGVSFQLQIYEDGVDYTGGVTDTLTLPTVPNNGEADVFVYFDPEWQLSDSWSLQNGDTEIVFAAPIPAATKVEIRVAEAITGIINVDMREIILEDGVDYTAGGGGPDTFALSSDPEEIENVWVSFDSGSGGVDQFDGFTLGAAPDITFPSGIPVGVTKVRIKWGSTSVVAGVRENYTELDDTPSNFTGDAYKAVRVAGNSTGLVHGGTGAVLIDSGTTAQRPGTPVNGMIRYNTDDDLLEARIAGAWASFGAGSIIGIQTFTANGTYTASAGTNNVLVICTGGGGGAGGDGSGSGAAGGTSSFGAFCSATGGNGGTTTSANSSLGGVGAGGDINIAGGDGHTSYGNDSASHRNDGGEGGASFWGGGGRGGDDNLAIAQNGRAYGSGGGAAYVGSNNAGFHGGGAGGTAIEHISSGFDGTSVTVGGAGGGAGASNGDGAAGVVVVIEFA